MRIQFHGADRTVTGSCHLIEVNGLRLLLDFGLYQGPRDQARAINTLVPADPKSIDAVILSHGHLDHCGRLPVLARSGYTGPIYCTPATADVARVVLQDAAKIQEEDADYLNRRSPIAHRDPVTPLYRQTDVSALLRLFKPVHRETPTQLAPGVRFTLYDAGHILGSTYVWLELIESNQPPRTLLFTADVGRYNTPIIRDPRPLPGPADFVITESTYGTVKHAPMDQVEPQLLDAVKACIARKGRLLLPSFAVGRTQVVLYYVQRFVRRKLIPPIPIYVDSPMGVEITQITTAHREEYDRETIAEIANADIFAQAGATFAASPSDSRKINNDRGPCVIIASSPTCEFGRILHHLAQSVESPNNMVLFTGWTPPQTLGRRLQDGAKRVRIFDRLYDVRCEIRTLHGLSAHADGDELVRFLKPTLRKETTAFVVHGEEDRAEGFAARLLSEGIGQAHVPAMFTSTLTGQVPTPKLAPDNTPATAPETKGEAQAAQE